MFSARTRGFTLIELMIGLAIFALLLMLALPAFSTMLLNQKLRAGAEAILNGLQTARAEAVKRNVQTQFVLTNDDANAGAVDAATPSVAGQNWLVRAPNNLGGNDFIEGKYGLEGAATSDIATTVTVAGSNPTGTFNGTVTFTGLGTTTLNSPATLQIANPAGGVCQAGGGPMRCLNVVVSPGGTIKMCDPAVTAAGDTRKC